MQMIHSPVKYLRFLKKRILSRQLVDLALVGLRFVHQAVVRLVGGPRLSL